MEQNCPLISIIVPCYNQAQYLSQALDSVLAQTYDNWECVIVNDGSPDNTLEIANNYALKDSRFIVVNKTNEGLAAARNSGILVSRGKYILPLDSDDRIDCTYTQKAVSYLEDHSNVKLVYCRASFFGDIDGEWNLPEYRYEDLIWQNMIFCSCVFRRADYDNTDGYNTNMRYGYEDWDFLLSLISPDDKVYQIPEVLFFYRKHGPSMISSLQERVSYMNMQMALNHPILYGGEIERTTEWINPLVSYYKDQADYYQKELENRINSRAYRLGRLLLLPFRLLKSFTIKR